MFSKVFSVSVNGLQGSRIDVEVDVANGMPAFAIVGLPDAAIQESRERVRSAIKNSGFGFPSTRITVNLAPADVRKRGPSFDLPIAIGILGRDFDFDETVINESLFVGELALDGKLRAANAILPSVLFAREKGFRTVFLPRENLLEASLIPDIRLVAADSLAEIVSYLTLEKPLPENEPIDPAALLERFGTEDSEVMGFEQVIGQEHAKRALLIAAAGGHNILME